MKIGLPLEHRTYRIFLSSGDDARSLRDRVDAIVNDAINPQLLDANADVRFEVDRWERTAAQRNEPGETTNERFVRRALKSNVTLSLLLDRIGAGTREELAAVLDTDGQVSALWFVAKDADPQTEVSEFLRPNRERLYYDKTGPPESDDSWVGIIRVLTGVLVEALTSSSEELFVEQRD
jgi:hypothetical protein